MTQELKAILYHSGKAILFHGGNIIATILSWLNLAGFLSWINLDNSYKILSIFLILTYIVTNLYKLYSDIKANKKNEKSFPLQ